MSSLPINPTESFKRRNPHLYGRPVGPRPEDAISDEADLQERIIRYCWDRKWFVLYSRMDRKSTTPLGSPDLVVFADRSRVFIIEAKSKTGKLRPDQLGVKIMLERCGHAHNVIRSMKEFEELVGQNFTEEFHELSQMAKDGVIK